MVISRPGDAMDQLTLRRPDDMHLHLRDGDRLGGLVAASAAHWARAIVMPNLVPPVRTVIEAAAYKGRIAGFGAPLEPLMTLYLTDSTEPDEIRRARESGFVHGVKLYPQGATTNSDAGVSDIEKVYPVLETMQEVGLPLLIHGEVTGDEHDIFDREERFIDTTLNELCRRFPDLRMVLEHMTTKAAVQWVEWKQGHSTPWVRDTQPPPTGVPRVAATITAHHLLENRNAIFRGGINPHNYCLPILKREEDRVALVEAATSGLPCFFAGTDSAPHAQHTKERAYGCAGCFTAPHALELYAEAFDDAGALDKLEDFTSRFGAEFYGLPLNEGTVTLVQNNVPVVKTIPNRHVLVDEGTHMLAVVPFWAGRTLKWRVKP